MKYCEFKLKDGFHQCGSAMFNLERDGIDQGTLCDVHYWETQCRQARNNLRECNNYYIKGLEDGRKEKGA